MHLHSLISFTQTKYKNKIIILLFHILPTQLKLKLRSSMALSSLNLHKFIFNTTTNCNYQQQQLSYYKTKSKNIGSGGRVRLVGGRCCSSAISINSGSSLTGVSSIRWGSTKLQGAREEMEDDVVIVKSSSHHHLDGFSFAAVFDGHAGYSSVKFLRFLISLLIVSCLVQIKLSHHLIDYVCLRGYHKGFNSIQFNSNTIIYLIPVFV